MHLLTYLRLSLTFIALVTAVTPGVKAQFSSEPRIPESLDGPLGTSWFTFGFRVRGFTSDPTGDGRVELTNPQPDTSLTFTTTSTAPNLGLGPVLEFNLTRKMSIRTEFLFHRLSYSKVTEIFQGTDDPDTSEDERVLTTLTERTKATQWDVPITVRYHGLRESGFLSRTYVAGGVAFRNIANIRTGNESVYSVPDEDPVNSYYESPVTPSKRNLLGAVVGIGFRFVDNFGLKLTPEVRYTRWAGASFASDSTRSPKGQIEVGIGLTF